MELGRWGFAGGCIEVEASPGDSKRLSGSGMEVVMSRCRARKSGSVARTLGVVSSEGSGGRR